MNKILKKLFLTLLIPATSSLFPAAKNNLLVQKCDDEDNFLRTLRKKIKPLIDAGALNKLNEDGRTFIGRVIDDINKHKNNIEFKCWLKVLIELGADLNQPDNNDITPIQKAADYNLKDIEGILITAGANLEESKLRSKIKLLANTADVEALNQVDERGLTLINKTINAININNNIVLKHRLKALLRSGVNINQSDSKGITPIKLAISCRLEDIVDDLIDAGVDLKTTYENGETVIDHAVKSCSFCNEASKRIIVTLVNAGVDPIQCNLLKYNANVKYKAGAVFFRGFAAELITEFPVANPFIIEAIRHNCISIVEALTRNSINLDVLDSYKQTPLGIAVEYGHEDIVRILLEAGANPNQLSAGATPLFIALKLNAIDMNKKREYNKKIFDLLVTYGAEADSAVMDYLLKYEENYKFPEKISVN